MRYGAAWLVLVLLALPAAAATPAEEARNGFAQQRVAWNRGDLEGALDLYWSSPELTWVDKGGVSKGFAEFARDMRADFAGKPAAMGTYSGEVLEARDIDADTALLVVRWAITRGGQRLMGGVSTQLWEPVGNRWRIVFEHASLPVIPANAGIPLLELAVDKEQAGFPLSRE